MADEDIVSQLKSKTKEEVILNINKLRNAIKRKHRHLKQDVLTNEASWAKKLKPVSEPLKKLLESGDRLLVKSEPESEMQSPTSPTFQGKVYMNKPPVTQNSETTDDQMGFQELGTGSEEMLNQNIANTGSPDIYQSFGASGEQLLNTPEGKNLAKEYINNQFQGRIAKEYFLKLINKGKAIDSTYGVRVDGDHWMLGDKLIDIEDDDIIMNGKKYRGTRGLYELIFMSSPNEYVYDESDLENYKAILLDSNVHRVGYSSSGKLRSSRGGKYKNLISVLLSTHEPVQSGKGLKTGFNQGLVSPYFNFANESVGQASNNSSGSSISHSYTEPNIMYWDDPNELVERLRKLGASQEAGNTGHNNEINAIIEELLELENTSALK